MFIQTCIFVHLLFPTARLCHQLVSPLPIFRPLFTHPPHTPTIDPQEESSSSLPHLGTVNQLLECAMEHIGELRFSPQSLRGRGGGK